MSASEEASCNTRWKTGIRFFLALATMFIALLAIQPVAKWLNLSGVRMTPLFLPMVLALVWMGYESMEWARKAGTLSPAMRAYFIRLTVSMTLYIVVLVAVITLFNRPTPPTGALAILLAVLPALPIVAVFWTIARLIIETTDEYQRLLLVKQTLLATALMLSISTVWAFLENFGQVPPIPKFHVGMLWFAMFGVSAPIVRLRA